MEALGGAASVIAVVQLAGKVWSICWKYYSDVKDARSDIERLMKIINAIQLMFQQLQELAKGLEATKLMSFKPLIENIPSEMKKELDQLVKKLDSGNANNSIMKTFGRRALKWPLQKDDVEKTVQFVERHKSTLNTVINSCQM